MMNLFHYMDRDPCPPIRPPPSALPTPGQYLPRVNHSYREPVPQPHLGNWPLPPQTATAVHEWQKLAYPIYGDPTPHATPSGTPPPPNPLGTPPPQGERVRPVWRCPDDVPTPVYPDPPDRPEKPYCPEEEEAGCTSSSDDSEPDGGGGGGEGDPKGDTKGDKKTRYNLWKRGILGGRHDPRRPEWVNGHVQFPVVADFPIRGGEPPRPGSGLSLEVEVEEEGAAPKGSGNAAEGLVAM